MSRFTRIARPGKIDNSGWTTLGILAVIGLMIGGFFLIRHLYRSHVLSPFEASRVEYLTLRPNPGGQTSEGLCKGGVITIDKTTSEFDHFFFDLPDELKPAEPASVKTIAFLNWTKVKVDEYTGGKPAYQHHCDVELVDRETKTLLRRVHFVGGEPPRSISSRSGSGEGSRPTEQMVNFIRASKQN